MTMTYSYTTAETFTIVHARKLAAKVIADMHQCKGFYGRPTSVEDWQEELIVKLAGEYVAIYEFGFRTDDDKRVLSWRYRVTAAGDLEGGRSGGLCATAKVANATWFNFLWHSSKWDDLSQEERDKVEAQHSITRTVGDAPTDGSGRWVRDRTFVSGGRALQREEFRPW
jgi:hypothetical protein